MPDRCTGAAGCLERQFQRVGDVTGLPVGAELPRDDIAAVVVENGAEMEVSPADHFEVGEVGLPELVRSCGLVSELVGGLDDYESRAGDQVMRLEDAVDGSL